MYLHHTDVWGFGFALVVFDHLGIARSQPLIFFLLDRPKPWASY